MSSCPFGTRVNSVLGLIFLFNYFSLPTLWEIVSPFDSPQTQLECAYTTLQSSFAFLSWIETQILCSYFFYRTFYAKLPMITKVRKRMTYNLNFKNTETVSLNLSL